MRSIFRPGLYFVLLLLISLAGCGKDTSRDPVSTLPDSLGFDEAVLVQLQQDAESGALGSVSSILIQREGTAVFEWYAPGWGVDVRHSCYSVTKSVLSLLVGIARDRDWNVDLDDLVTGLLPDYASLLENDSAKRGITLRHLLAMRAGFDWPELSIPYSNQSNPLNGLIVSDNWVEHALSQPMAAQPGVLFCYNSGISTVVSAIFQEEMGIRADQFASQALFAPLGIEEWSWSLTPTGLTCGGWGLSLRPRDMAKIGNLVLGDGVYADQRIISAEWLDLSFHPETHFTNGQEYGLHWWLEPVTEFSGVEPVPAALGYGGQAIYAIRELDLVVVITAEEYNSYIYPPPVILHNYVLPAIVDRTD